MLVIGEKDVNSMNNNITYTDEPMELGAVVKDFLPPPEELMPKTNKVIVTLELRQETVNFFKAEEKKQRSSYQEIISLLVDKYAEKK